MNHLSAKIPPKKSVKWISHLILLFFVFVASCTLAKVKIDVVSERTALENQVLGTYNSLDREMLLMASVRGVDSEGQIKKPPKQSQDKKDALNAMQVLAFHEDDLNAFKRLGWVGENNQGLLAVFSMNKSNPPEDLKGFVNRYAEAEFKAVIEKINQAREAMMQRVIDMNENFSSADEPQIRKIFGKLNADNAKPGEKYQTQDGAWEIKQ
jgi:uncharacterized protein YdbL (DUF1318 family)